MKNTIALIFVASTLVLAGCCTTYHAKNWEYKTVNGRVMGNGVSLQDAINREANEGWQFVCSAPLEGPNDFAYAVLKREKK